jgi:hypothetical protein
MLRVAPDKINVRCLRLYDAGSSRLIDIELVSKPPRKTEAKGQERRRRRRDRIRSSFTRRKRILQ